MPFKNSDVSSSSVLSSPSDSLATFFSSDKPIERALQGIVNAAR